MAILTMPRMTALRMGTMGRIGLLAASSLAPDRGFMGRMASTATWITATILAMDIMGHCQITGSRRSTTSMRMRRGTGKGMWATPAMMVAVSTAVVMQVTVAVVTVVAVVTRSDPRYAVTTWVWFRVVTEADSLRE